MMRTSIVAFILCGSLLFAAFAFGLSYSQARGSLHSFAETARVHRSHARLDELRGSAEIWIARHSSRLADLGSHSILIQGVMQPEHRLRELRRFLDHVAWDGETIQLSVLDFEGSPLYQRFDAPARAVGKDDWIRAILEGQRQRVDRVHVEDGQAWITMGAPIGRAGFVEGVVLATLPLGALSRVLQTGPLDGLELRLGEQVLERRGDATGGEQMALGESGLVARFRPDLVHLDTAMASLERWLAIDLLVASLAAVALLSVSMRVFLANPLRRLVSSIERLDAENPDERVPRSHPFEELARLSNAFNRLLDRLGESRRRILDANQKLETRVARRTAELAERNRDLEQFAYVASHDLQEPLRKIACFSQLLEAEHAEQLDEDGRQYLRIVADAAIRMSQLIQDLLEFSRIGRSGRDFATVDLNEIVARVLNDLSQMVSESGAQLRIDELPWVRGTPPYLTQLYLNLITNALKFAGEAPPDVHVGVESVDPEELRCVLFVRDRGIGIAPRYAEKIFEMFERLHPVEQYGGTGIGLPICKRVIEELEGQLWLESAEGQGATFYFSLPLAEPSEKDAAASGR